MKLEITKGTIGVANTAEVIEDRVDKLELATDAKLKEEIEKVETRIDNEMLEVEKVLIEVLHHTRASIDNAIDAYDAQLQPVDIVVGAHPKKRSKNKFIQWLLIKLLGYELEYKTAMVKTIIDTGDCSFDDDDYLELPF